MCSIPGAAHPLEEVNEVIAGRRKDIKVFHYFVAYRLDVMLDPGGDQHDRAGPHGVALLSDLIVGVAGYDQRYLVEVVNVWPEVHSGFTLVHNQKHPVGAEAAAADAGPDCLIGDLVPGDCGHG